MFDIMKIAAKIKESRIAKNMTQMNLAEEMEVSYQAVSSWERGNSMPDLGKIGKLCEVLEISIDELLGQEKKSKVIKKGIEAPELTEVEWQAEELEEIAPLLTPQEMGKCTEKVKKIAFEEVMALAPFLPSDKLGELVKSALEDVESIDLSQIIAIAAFLDGYDLAEIVEKAVPHSVDEVICLAPFLPSKALGKLLKQVLGDDGKVDMKWLETIVPFLDGKDLGEFVKRAEIKDMNQIINLAPFLNGNVLGDLVESIVKNSMKTGDR